MNSWHSYPSIFALGHRAIVDLLTVPVNVEEKVDGSQFSAGIDEEGNIHVRSKGATMIPDAPEKMFTSAVDTIKSLAGSLHPAWTYRFEYLAKPKHNALCYGRIPKGHLILFDVNADHESYLSYDDKKAEGERLGLETVQLLFSGMLTKIEEFRQFLDTESVLGGQKIEGVVVKPRDYNLFGQDKKVLMGKFVSEAFKEVHAQEWKAANPHSRDILSMISDSYHSPARWQKAIIHMEERGQLEGSPRDIGNLMKEVPLDIEKECEQEIKDRLWQWAWPQIRRATIRGLPEWYKERLLTKQFDGTGIDDAQQVSPSVLNLGAAAKETHEKERG